MDILTQKCMKDDSKENVYFYNSIAYVYKQKLESGEVLIETKDQDKSNFARFLNEPKNYEQIQFKIIYSRKEWSRRQRNCLSVILPLKEVPDFRILMAICRITLRILYFMGARILLTILAATIFAF